MRIIKRQSIILLVLGILFAAPGLLAYWFYNHPTCLGSHGTNKGRLLTPPPLFSALNTKMKWSLILWAPTGCDNRCHAQLEKLARIRLSLGRHLYQIDQWLVLPDTVVLKKDTISSLDEQNIRVMRLSVENCHQLSSFQEPSVLIANPEHYLILAYSLTTDSNDIYHDLKHLIK